MVVGLGIGDQAAGSALADAGVARAADIRVEESIVDTRAAMRAGASTVLVGERHAALVLTRSATVGYCALRGIAIGDGGRSRTTADGVLDQARTIRRALADGRMKAAQVGYARIVHTDPNDDRAVSVLARALGPFYERVVVQLVSVAGPAQVAVANAVWGAVAVAVRWSAAADRLERAPLEVSGVAREIEAELGGRNVSVALSVTLAADGTTTALAFGRSR